MKKKKKLKKKIEQRQKREENKPKKIMKHFWRVYSEDQFILWISSEVRTHMITTKMEKKKKKHWK